MRCEEINVCSQERTVLNLILRVAEMPSDIRVGVRFLQNHEYKGGKQNCQQDWETEKPPE